MTRFPKPLRLPLLAVCVFAAVIASAGVGRPGTAPRTHDAVWAYVNAHPGERVPVIVQADATRDPFELVRDAGGEVTNVLGLIHSVAADVPADRLAALTREDGVRWVSLDAPVASTADPKNDPVAASTGQPVSVYPQAIVADEVWKDGGFGQGVGVAVVDTGVAPSADFAGPDGRSRVVANGGRENAVRDGYGHGTHVAGLVAGTGSNSNFRYVGVAPGANIINVKVGADDGSATVSDVINGLQFVLDNQATYNIRVVNLSLRSDVPQSYTTDPLDAAVELLTFRGILVVAAAGNTGTAADAVSYAPANDPFVLTIGAVDDNATADRSDDSIPFWSSRGTTQDGFSKPDIYTPGRRLVSVLSPGSVLARELPNNIVGTDYFQLSGTSMAAGVASGAAALVFQAHPDWTPGQVKLALAQEAGRVQGDDSARFTRVDRTVKLDTPPVDTTLDIVPNDLLLEAAAQANPGVTFDKISWSRISWSKISWSKISWSKISWSKISWSRISWGNVPE